MSEAYKCDCVGQFGPNPDCMGCGGDGTVEIEEPIKMPDAHKLADLLLSQQWVAFDSSAEYEEFVSALGCNLYDPAVQPAPGGEDVVLSAARTAPAEGIAIGSLSREAGSERIVLDPIGDPHIKDGMVVYTAPDALQAEVERLRADAERYRWARSKHRIQDAICFELDSDAETDRQMDEAVDAEIARIAEPEVKS